MAGGKIIYFDGDAMELQLPDGGLDNLLRGNYLYASINCVGNRPLFLSRHIGHLRAAYAAVYDFEPAIRDVDTFEAIQRLLYLNGASLSGNVVTIYLLPPEDFVFADSLQPRVLIAHERTVMYGSGYTLASLRPSAMVANYDIPFETCRTAVSLTTAQYMDTFAGRRDAGIAIRCTRSGSVVSSGDYPLFVVHGGRVFAQPAGKGIGDSLERRLMLELCGRCGIEVEDRETTLAELTEADEIVIFRNTGIVSPLRIGTHYFTNLLALRLERLLPQLTEEGLER